MRKISVFVLLLLFAFACSEEEDNAINDTGTDVLVGDVGETGDSGDVGETGDSGDVGETGDSGEVGETGDSGGKKEEDYAFIVNAAPDYKSATYSVMKVSDKSVSKDKGADIIHTDAVVRTYNGLIYVVNRFGADNITILDPKNNFSIVKQFSVGAGSNPQDIVVLNDKIFITKMNSNEVDIYNSSDYSKSGGIDLSKYADSDNIAEPQDMILYKDKLYITVLRLDQNNYFSPTDKSYLLVVDPSGVKVQKEIELGKPNPAGGIFLDEENNRIIIAETGSFGATDGRVELLDINSDAITQQVIPESEWGGDLNKIVYAKNRIFAVISDANFNTSLKSYSFESAKIETVYSTTGFSISGISLYNNLELYLCDRTVEKPGLRVFDIEDLTQKTTDPIDTGLPPVSLVFFRM